MNLATLNIGLNVGPTENPTQLSKTISLLSTLFITQNLKIVEGFYQGQTERTLVIQIKHTHNIKDLTNCIAQVSKYLQQDCIALYIEKHHETNFENNGALVYPIDYQGEKLKFSQEYFNKI